MDSLELNKAFAAVLTAGIAFMGAGILSDVLVRPRRPEKTVIKVEGVEVVATPAPDAPKGPVVPISNLLANADIGAGETAAKRLCASCHSFNEGGKSMVGPNLYGVVGAPHGHVDGYQYSAVIKGKQGPWSYDALNEWLLNPRGYAPGTKMAFAGIGNDKQRADVIAYLRSLAKDPQPLPQPVAQPTAEQSAAGTNAAGGATPTSPQSGGAARSEGGTGAQSGQVRGAASANPAGAGAGVSSGTVGQASQPTVSQNQSQSEQNQSQNPPQVTPSR